MAEQITFSFGENWLNYLDSLTQERFREAQHSLVHLLQTENLTGRVLLDIGCGSGLFSAAALSMGAYSVISIDVDPKSVQACEQIKQQVGATDAWVIQQGSILDDAFVQQLPVVDIVYSWGVLHHTGAMWQAITNAATRVKPGGLFVLAIYNRHRSSDFWLKFKQIYNRSGNVIQKLMLWSTFAPRAAMRLLKGKDPFKGERGMSIYYDAIDWAGGLPYEYASFDEIVRFCATQNFTLVNAIRTNSTGCNQFVFKKL